jgi:hypothetical protein
VNAALPLLEPGEDESLSVARSKEPVSKKGAESVDDQIDGAGSATKMRFSKMLTSKPGTAAARRSIAAMRFSNSSPFTTLIEPERIAA